MWEEVIEIFKDVMAFMIPVLVVLVIFWTIINAQDFERGLGWRSAAVPQPCLTIHNNGSLTIQGKILKPDENVKVWEMGKIIECIMESR